MLEYLVYTQQLASTIRKSEWLGCCRLIRDVGELLLLSSSFGLFSTITRQQYTSPIVAAGMQQTHPAGEVDNLPFVTIAQGGLLSPQR